LEKRINPGGRIKPNEIYVLIETKNVSGTSIILLNDREEVFDCVWARIVEHDTEGNATILDYLRNPCAPKVDHHGVIFEEINPRVLAYTPSNSELCGTGAGVLGVGYGIPGRPGGRQGNVDLGRVGLAGAGSTCWFGSGAGRLGLASCVITLLLLGDAVVVRNLSSQVVRLYGNRKAPGWSEREEKDGECG